MMSIGYLSKLATVVCLCLLVTLAGCKSSKSQPNSEVAQKSLDALAKEKYGTKAVIAFNKSKSHALVSKVQKPDPKAAFTSVHFFVYDENTGKIIHEDFINQGEVKWISDRQIEVSYVLEVYREGASTGYLFDVQTAEKKIN